MKVLFIGGTGNISAECVEWLRKQAQDITVVTRGKNPVAPGCRALVADRFDRESFRRAIQRLRFDVVVNFLGFDLPELDIDFELFRSRVRQYVFISSATVYAKPHRRLPLTEEASLGNPFSDYARKKLACEQWLRERHSQDFPVTIVRPSHTYSRHWIPNAVASSDYTFAARVEQGKPVFVHDDGQGLWTLTSAADFAVGLAGLLGAKPAVGETFHITSDEVLTWNQVYAEIARALGGKEPAVEKIPTDFICGVVPDMTAKLKGDKSEPGVFDNAKIKRTVPAFACRTCFREGIRQSVAWFRASSARKKTSPAVDKIFDDVIDAWRKRN
jgi:nucleoside-diphosphate-sugar epimerase